MDPMFSLVPYERHKMNTVDAVTSPKWAGFFKALSQVVVGTIADVEFVHNRNRIKATSPAHRNMAWSTLSSSCLNHEALLDS